MLAGRRTIEGTARSSSHEVCHLMSRRTRQAESMIAKIGRTINGAELYNDGRWPMTPRSQPTTDQGNRMPRRTTSDYEHVRRH